MRQSSITSYSYCPYNYYLYNVRKLELVPKQDPQDARTIGTMFHMAIEHGIDAAVDWYYSQYYVINDLQVTEVLKLQLMYPKIMEVVNSLGVEYQNEVRWEYGEWSGTVDILYRHDNDFDLFDFKYSNNVANYLKSPQLHIYKYFLEKVGYKINKIGFIFIPKTMIRQKKDESLYQFRKRVQETLDPLEPKVITLDYDYTKVEQALQLGKTIETNQVSPVLYCGNNFPKKKSKLCDWCDYQQFCVKGDETMILPTNTRSTININITPDMWLYGQSYSGKTVFMDTFDNVIMLNTDGNVDHISSPVIPIKDEINVQSRIITRKYAWEVFNDAVTELEKKQNTFKTVVVDLLEDLYEHCRIAMYEKMHIEHESDAGYGKGYDVIRTEFLSTIKRLKNCGYQLVYISKEISSEVTRRGGEKITTVKPNLPDKLANILAGTVDLTARVIAEGNDRYLNLKTSEYIFGGSRYNFGVDKISLNKNTFIETLKKSQIKKEG